jgi:CheY-like chemotaxis protein/two-component sensor histidine kinase
MSEQAGFETAAGQRSARKAEFLAILAHELRNPLAPIRNAVQFLRELDAQNPRAEWAREVIDRQVNHLAKLVDDLLAVSELMQGRINLQKRSIDVADFLEQALENNRPLIRSRRHELVVSLPAEAFYVHGDPVRLEQVAHNLLHNAARYTPEGGRLRLEAYPEDGQAVIRVKDNGIGINGDLLPRVFDLFGQDGQGPDQNPGGLGLGLPIAKQLVDLHGGRIEANSEGAGKGSEFTVRLPLDSDVSQAVAPLTPAEPSPFPGTPLRVLVVDDNRDAVESLSVLLELEGHAVQSAPDGLQALELAPSFLPQVILLDIGLPGMDGYEVAQRLRDLPETRQALLVAVTGYGQPEDRARSRAAGFDHHLVKPIDLGELSGLLASYQ